MIDVILDCLHGSQAAGPANHPAEDREDVGVSIAASVPVDPTLRGLDLTKQAKLDCCQMTKDIIKASGKSHAEIARILGVDRQLIGQWTTGVRKPMLSTILKLLSALGYRLVIELAEEI